jgi:hypothetical protein
MGGGLLNLVASGELNVILNGNPQKTFFKTTYPKYKNFGIQRFNIPFKDLNSINLFNDSKFRFTIPLNGDLITDTFFSIYFPDIYSPIYTIPIPRHSEGSETGKPISKDLSGLIYCQPYEFKWIENLGVQTIKQVTYYIDGRPIQQYSGQYLYCKAQRDLSKDKLDLFNKMIGNVKEFTDPANWGGRNGNYPSVSWSGLSRQEWPNGLEPSIRGRRIFVPLYLWETFSSYQSFPIVSLYYSKLEIEIELRPFNELCLVRDLDYFERWVADISMVTQIPSGKNCSNVFKYYDPPYIRPNFEDARYFVQFFLLPPPEKSFCIGDQYFSYNATPGPDQQINTQQFLKNLSNTWYSPNIGFAAIQDISIIATYAFLDEEERVKFTGLPQEYLVKQVFEKTIPNVQGVRREPVDAIGLTVSWMWYFQRTDVVLRNEWSNYSNWPYNNQMPYPCILSSDLSYSLVDLMSINTPYINPIEPFYTPVNVSDAVNGCLQYITGPTHPGNVKDIMVDWGLYCDNLERESIMPAGVNNYLEKYLITEGAAKDGIYCYNFNIEKNTNLQPSGCMNMRKFTQVAFEFTTIDPYREMLPEEYINEYELASYKIKKNCTNRGLDFSEAWLDVDNYFNQKAPGGEIDVVEDSKYTNFDYNFNLHIMEERYNILQFSGGMARYLFPT